jgi:hypothetical protein
VWSVHASIELERSGVPTVALVTAAFEAGARAAARARGFDELPIITFAADFEEQDDAAMRAEFAARLPEITRGLQRD